MTDAHWDIASYGQLLRRRSRLALLFASWRAFLTVPAIVLLVIAGIAWGAAVHIGYRESLLADAALAEATVTGRRVEVLETNDYYGHGNGQVKRFYHIEYTFQTPAGRRVTEEREVSRWVHDSMPEGQTLEIEYAPSRPTVSRPTANREANRTAKAVIGPAMLTTLAGVLLWRAWRGVRSDESLLAGGQVVRGEVIEWVPAEDHLPARLRYRYQPLCAPLSEGQEEMHHESDPLWGLGPGDPITIVYDPADPGAGRALRPHLAKRLKSSS